MEAALWGRLETVQYLTAQGVHVPARDANGMNALELALNSSRNKGERISRAGSVYRELADADDQRARVESHLRRLSNVSVDCRTLKTSLGAAHHSFSVLRTGILLCTDLKLSF
jgi:hypothetical protein